MKAYLLLILSLLILSSCGNEKNPIPDVTGKWLRKDAPPGNGLNDTIFFLANGQAIIQGVEFLYAINTDSIHFSYNGPLYIFCPTSAHNYSISGSIPTLSIENLNKLCLIETDRGISIYQKLTE